MFRLAVPSAQKSKMGKYRVTLERPRQVELGRVRRDRGLTGACPRGRGSRVRTWALSAVLSARGGARGRGAMGNRSATDAGELLSGRGPGADRGAGAPAGLAGPAGPGAVAALVGGVLLIGSVLAGNSLVCVSVAAERALQTPTNYFIVSLAAADLLLALLVLPLFVYSEVSAAAAAAGPSATPPLAFPGTPSRAPLRVPLGAHPTPISGPSARLAVRPLFLFCPACCPFL